MKTYLVRVDRGGHRATAHWTRHALDPLDNRRMLCGIRPDSVNITDDEPGTQGVVRTCQRCAKRGAA